MAAYARQAKDTEMIQWVTEIKVRAERKAGELLASMDKNTGAMGVGSNQHEVRSYDATAPKLSDLGISKDNSSRWQKLAAMPDSEFEQALNVAKERAGEVTTAAMLRAARPLKPVEPEQVVAEDENVTSNVASGNIAPSGDDEINAFLLKDLEAADKQVRELTALVDKLTATDTGRVIAQLEDRCLGLEGVNRQLNTTLNEAKKDAQYWRNRFMELGALVGEKNPANVKSAVSAAIKAAEGVV
jgi:hypothetical protein